MEIISKYVNKDHLSGATTDREKFLLMGQNF